MTDIFISYAHEDQPFVMRMVERLQADGFSVWWDHAIPPGKSWDEVIAAGIQNAKACIVVWSKHSIDSEWVKEEATLAREARKYLPVSVDESLPPMGFRRIQSAHLDQWTGDPNDGQWRMLTAEAHSLLEAAKAAGDAPPAPTPPPRPAYQPQPAYQPPPPAAAQTPPPRAARGDDDKSGGLPKPVLVALISGAATFILLFVISLFGGDNDGPASAAATATPPAAMEAYDSAGVAPPPTGGLSADAVTAQAGAWTSDGQAPANPGGYYMIANDNFGHAGYVGMGSIVTIQQCTSVNCQIDIQYGYGSNSCSGWYVVPTDMTYLGPDYQPGWQAISDELYQRESNRSQLGARCTP